MERINSVDQQDMFYYITWPSEITIHLRRDVWNHTSKIQTADITGALVAFQTWSIWKFQAMRINSWARWFVQFTILPPRLLLSPAP